MVTLGSAPLSDVKVSFQVALSAEAIGEAEAYIDASGALRQRLFIDWDSRTITEIPAGKGAD